jgi:hypothetical protein
MLGLSVGGARSSTRNAPDSSWIHQELRSISVVSGVVQGCRCLLPGVRFVRSFRPWLRAYTRWPYACQCLLSPLRGAVQRRAPSVHLRHSVGIRECSMLWRCVMTGACGHRSCSGGCAGSGGHGWFWHPWSSNTRSGPGLRVWSAGINRHGDGDESALRRRASDPRWRIPRSPVRVVAGGPLENAEAVRLR